MEITKAGLIEFDLAKTEFDDDWFVARRLLLEGSPKSLKKLEVMKGSEMVTLEEFEAILEQKEE